MKNRLTSIMLVSLLVIGGFVGFMNFESKNARGTNVSGIVYDGSGGPWTPAGSPYIVVGDVTVPTGETLTIESGVEVKFDGYYSLYVDGNLMATGTETSRINITSNIVPSAHSDWRDIQIHSTGHTEIKYCNISYAYTSIRLYASNNNITNNNLWYNNYVIDVWGSSNNNITSNNFYSNGATCINLRPSSSNNIIVNNNLSNSVRGLILQESSNIAITNNNISNNGGGIRIGGSINITITNNNFTNDGVYLTGDQLSHYNSHNIPDDNIINGKPLLYYKDSSNINIDGIPVGQVILANCSDSEVRGLQINNVDSGIQVYYSNDIIITNNDISLSDFEGIRLVESSNNTINDNNVTNNGYGITIYDKSNNNIITNNNVTLSNQVSSYGIRVSLSSNNSIMDNCVCNNFIGIGLEAFSSNNTVIGNNVSNNDYGIDLVFSPSENVIEWNTISSNNRYGIYFSSSAYNNVIRNNNISDGDYGIYFKSSNSNIITDNIISNNNNGSFLQESSNNIITNNYISKNGNGIYLHYSFDNNIVMSNTIILSSNNGIHIKGTANNNITGNTISDNYNGINISQSSNDNLIRGNTVSNNDYGFYIDWTSDNLIYHNNIINNIIQAYDETVNGTQWENGYPSGGNYWSDFDEPGEDAYDDYQGINQDIIGSDGIVDNGSTAGGGMNPYIIDSDSQDNYPLMDLIINRTFLYECWNLISIPFIQTDTNLSIVLAPIMGSYDAVQWYNVSEISDHWKHNHISKPSQLNDLNDIDHTMGFWIHVTEPGGVLFEYSGSKPTQNQTIHLTRGWNLVGYPSLSNKNRTNALNNINFESDVDAIWTYSSASQKWKEITASDNFEVGRGYWVHSKVSKTWIVPL